MKRRFLKHTVSLLHVDYAVLDANWNFTNVISPYYRIYLIDQGEGLITCASTKIRLLPGNLYIIPSFTPCNMYCPSSMGQLFVHFFEESPDGLSLFHYNRMPLCVSATDMDDALMKRLLTINPGRGINRSINPKVYEKENFYHEYEQLNSRQPDSEYLETHGILLQLISRFLKNEKSDGPVHGSIPSKILEAMAFIQLNLQKELTVSQLAASVNQHIDYFSRRFEQYTGERPINYIHQKRIERAQHLITTTNMPLAEIACAVGFESIPYFTKIFKKTTQTTPALYRKQQAFRSV